MERMVQNILAVYSRATPADTAYGRQWYKAAHDYAVGLAARYGVSVKVACGIIAVLSPRVNWGLNMAYAAEWLEYRDCPTFARTLSKLHAITACGVNAGHIFDMGDGYGPRVYKRAISGPKVTRFFLCILNPRRNDIVVIDRHAYGIALGLRLDDHGLDGLDRVGEYERVQAAYIEAGKRLGVLPSVVQATTWVTWRRENNVHDYHDEDFYEEF